MNFWILAVVLTATAVAQTPAGTPVTERERALLERIERLEQRLAALEAKSGTAAPASSSTPAPPSVSEPAAQEQRSPTGDSSSLPGFAAGTTLNLLLDGYYESNFNRPSGRVNLLRPFDPTSNSFTLNQAVLVLERAADASQGRRFGARLDLMFGQSTESLAGNPANELRTAPYRNIYQAYGTYIFPVGKGLNFDFGRFASSLGVEGTFAKDQINYSRSLLFTALPFYHLGFRTAYKLSDKATASWLVVNGLNQSEDFNGFKSNHYMLSTNPTKTLTWTASYYNGQEGRQQTGAGLRRPDGRTHIADSYLTWKATPKLTLIGEGDYIVSRDFSNSNPSWLAGGAGYIKYQFQSKLSLAGRFEYVSDRGGYLSGMTQALKEGTVTAVYQPLEGFQMRWEVRRDYSNQPYFLSHPAGALKKEQNTALLGLLWWFGGKQGTW